MVKKKNRGLGFIRLIVFLILAGRGLSEVNAQTSDAAKNTRTDALGDPLPPGASARLGTLRMRIPLGNNPHAAITPDGKHLVSLGNPPWIQVWDAATGKETRRFSSPRFGYYPAIPVFSPDGKFLVTEYAEEDLNPKKDHGLVVWDFTTGKELYRLKHPGFKPVYGFTEGGKTLMCWNCEEGTLLFWDLKTGKMGPSWEPLRELGIKQPRGNKRIDAVISQDGKTMVLKLTEQNVKTRSSLVALSLVEKRELWQQTNGDIQLGMALAGDANLFASLTKEGVLYIRNATTGKPLHQLAARPISEFEFGSGVSLAFSGNGKTLVVTESAKSKRAFIWDTASGKKQLEIPLGTHLNSRLFGAGAVFFPDDDRILLSVNNQMRIWSLTEQKETLMLPGHREAVQHLTFTNDGKTLISGIAGPKLDFPLFGGWGYPLEAIHWDTATWTTLSRTLVPDDWHRQRPAAVSPMHDFSVAVNNDKSLEIRSFPGDKLLRTLAAQPAEAWQPNGYVSPDGKILLVHGIRPKAAIPVPQREAVTDVIDLDSGQKLGAIPINSNRQRAAFGKGKPLVAWRPNDGRIGVFDPRLQNPIVYLKEGNVKKSVVGWQPLAFSYDGRFLAEWDGQAKKAVIWDLANGKVFRQIPESREPLKYGTATCLEFSPDGAFLAVCGLDHGNNSDVKKDIEVWEVATGKVVRLLVGHEAVVTALAWSPDGRWLASGSDDTTVLVWDLTR